MYPNFCYDFFVNSLLNNPLTCYYCYAKKWRFAFRCVNIYVTSAHSVTSNFKPHTLRQLGDWRHKSLGKMDRGIETCANFLN